MVDNVGCGDGRWEPVQLGGWFIYRSHYSEETAKERFIS
jgi:hypothetical protein